jgi:hypothetical protein
MRHYCLQIFFESNYTRLKDFKQVLRKASRWESINFNEILSFTFLGQSTLLFSPPGFSFIESFFYLIIFKLSEAAKALKRANPASVSFQHRLRFRYCKAVKGAKWANPSSVRFIQ